MRPDKKSKLLNKTFEQMRLQRKTLEETLSDNPVSQQKDPYILVRRDLRS